MKSSLPLLEVWQGLLHVQWTQKSLSTQNEKRRRCQKLWKLKHEKERGKDEPTYLLLLAIQWNGMERLQQDTQMQINNVVKTITQKVTIEERTLIKFVCIFMGAPCLELHHQFVPNFGPQRMKLS
jgi:hypothetical protein